MSPEPGRWRWPDAHVPPPTRTRSLYQNKIGDEGGKALGEALKTNAALTDLKYVTGAAVSPSSGFVSPYPGRWRWPDAHIPPPARTRSLEGNEIGDETEAAIRGAWKHGRGLVL